MKIAPYNANSITPENWPFKLKVQPKVNTYIACQFLLPEGFTLNVTENNKTVKKVGKAGDYILCDSSGNKMIITEDEFTAKYEIIPDPAVMQVPVSNRMGAQVGNKVSAGLGNLFAGTSWG